MWKFSQRSQQNTNAIINKKIPSIIADILEKRGNTSLQSMLDYLRPSLFDLNSPFLFHDMHRVIDRLENAHNAQETILIYGDYDADGVTGTALLYKVLLDFGFNVMVHIPTREEGYGLHRTIIDKAASHKVTLVITVDCGITAYEESVYAQEQGIDLIITDHHEPPEQLPIAIGIINPKVKHSGYPFTHLAGVGVAFKLVQAIYNRFGYPGPPCLTEIEYLDLVALGTIADLVPLQGENRIFVKYGLEMMEKTKHTGIKAILEECGLQGKKLKAGQISFIVAPRINAAGRMDTARRALNLLLENEYEDALTIARDLSQENYQRQLTEKEIVNEAESIILRDPLPKVIVLSSSAWHHGVIGIVASRLVERFQRPVFLISEEGEIGKGSARGVPDYHVLDELTKQASLLSKFGGHKQAAGFTLPINNINLLRVGLNESVADTDFSTEPQYHIDSIIDWNEIVVDLIHELEQMAPYGMGNPAPIFMSQELKIDKVMTMGKNAEHLKLILSSNLKKHEVVAFHRGKEFEQLKNMGIIDIIYSLETNSYMGVDKIQAILKDYRLTTGDIYTEIACASESEWIEESKLAEEYEYPVSRRMLVDFYKSLKEKSEGTEFLTWIPEQEDHSVQLLMIKIFEELGIIRWIGGTNPYYLTLNKVDKTQLENSLRFRIHS